jgi:hypothetical protein
MRAALGTASWNPFPPLSRSRDNTGQMCSGPSIGFPFSALTRSFLKTDSIPTVRDSEYEEYYINAWARPEFTNGYTSVGIVSRQNQLGSFVQVQQTEGRFFQIKEDDIRLRKHRLIDGSVEAIRRICLTNSRELRVKLPGLKLNVESRAVTSPVSS